MSETKRIDAYKTADNRPATQKRIEIIRCKRKTKGFPYKFDFIDLDVNEEDRTKELLQVPENIYDTHMPFSFKEGNDYLICMIHNVGVVYDIDSDKIDIISDVTDLREASDDKPLSDSNDDAFQKGSQSLTSQEKYNQEVIKDMKQDVIRLEDLKGDDKSKRNRKITGANDGVFESKSLSTLPSKHQTSLLAYLPSIEEATAYFKYLQDFKLSVLDKTDLLKIKGNVHICRSGWEKFVNIFQLKHQIISAKKEITRQHLVTYKYKYVSGRKIKEIDKDEWLDGIQYTVIVEILAPNGFSAQGIGLVQQYEGGREDRTEHDILAHAETRAFNRACSKIVGLGEVSAEEIN
jgi:hypothetical protein